jgi:hypothetical protein
MVIEGENVGLGRVQIGELQSCGSNWNSTRIPLYVHDRDDDHDDHKRIEDQ